MATCGHNAYVEDMRITCNGTVSHTEAVLDPARIASGKVYKRVSIRPWATASTQLCLRLPTGDRGRCPSAIHDILWLYISHELRG